MFDRADCGPGLMTPVADCDGGGSNMSESIQLTNRAQYASVQVMHALRDMLALVGVFATVFLIGRALYLPAMALTRGDAPQAVFGAIQPAPLADGDELDRKS